MINVLVQGLTAVWCVVAVVGSAVCTAKWALQRPGAPVASQWLWGLAGVCFAVSLGLVLSVSPAVGSVIASDDFNRADSADLGAGWTSFRSGTTVRMQVASNQAAGSGTTQNLSDARDVGTPNGSVSAVVSVMPVTTSANVFGLTARVNTASTTGGNRLMLNLPWTPACGGIGRGLVLQQMSGATTTALSPVICNAVSVGQTITLAVTGTTATGYVNGVEKVTGTYSGADSNFFGLMGGAETSNGGRLDNWAFDDVPLNLPTTTTTTTAPPTTTTTAPPTTTTTAAVDGGETFTESTGVDQETVAVVLGFGGLLGGAGTASLLLPRRSRRSGKK